MNRKVLLIAVLFMGGCCAADAQVASRDRLLRQIDDNLMNDIGPKYKKYLDADAVRPQALKDNDYDVVNVTHKAIMRVVSSTPAAVATKAGG